MNLKWISACVFLMVSLGACSHGRKHKEPMDHHKAAMKYHKMMWDKMDANSDGTVTKEEFDKMHAEQFKKLDTNGDGKVTAEEHKACKVKMMDGKKKSCCSGEKDGKKSCKSGEC